MTMNPRRMRALCVALIAVSWFALTTRDTQAVTYNPADTSMAFIELARPPVQLGPADDYPGMWEYIYDVNHAVGTWEANIRLRGFEADNTANLHDVGSGDRLYQLWDGHVSGGWTLWGGFWDKSIRPSYWNGTGLQWGLPSDPGNPNNCIGCANVAYEFINPVHHPFEYNNASIFYGNGGGILGDIDAGISGNDQIEFSVFNPGAPNQVGIGGLGMTFRVVHPNAPGTIDWSIRFWAGDSTDILGEIQGPAPVTGPTSCLIGDVNCDGYVEIGADILTAFTNFTGPGSFGKVRATGDVHGPSVATTAVLGHDGDVDVSDILTIFGAFTGPPPDEGSGGGLGGPAEAGDPSIPDLIYDASTGEVTLDADGSSIIGYSLQNATNSFLPAGHTPILAGVTTALTSQLEEAA
ncbi:MAG: hypothetical protein DWQ35_11230, partial [Planctomycetota bacterium]